MSTYIEAPTRGGTYRHHPAAGIEGATIGQQAVIGWAQIGAAVIGDRTEIGNFTSVMDGAMIGDDCKIHNNVVINRGVVIGSLVKIQNQVSIPPGVTVQSCAFIGPGAKFPNDRYPRSFIAYHPGPETVVQFGASVGANATVVCGEVYPTMVGEFSLLAAGSTATRSLRPFGQYIGNEQYGWVNVLGETISQDPRRIPPTAELLQGLENLPSELRPADQTINEMLQYAQVGLEG